MAKIELVTHYSVEDPECGGDYHSIDVKVDGVVFQTYGDYYHDKGWERAQGFLDGLRAAGCELAVAEIDVADSEL